MFILGDSTCGQRALYQFGLTGIPVYNVSVSSLKVVCILLFLMQMHQDQTFKFYRSGLENQKILLDWFIGPRGVIRTLSNF